MHDLLTTSCTVTSATGFTFKYGKFNIGADSVDGQNDSGDVFPHTFVSKSLSIKDSDSLVRKLLGFPDKKDK